MKRITILVMGHTTVALASSIVLDGGLASGSDLPHGGELLAVGTSLMVVFAYLIGVQVPRPSLLSATSRAIAASLAAFCVTIMFNSIMVHSDILNSKTVVPAGVASLWNIVFAFANSHLTELARVYLVASDEEISLLASEGPRQLQRPARIVGTTSLAGLDPLDNLEGHVRNASASVLVLDRYAMMEPRVVDAALELHNTGVRVRTLDMFYRQWYGKIPHTQLDQNSLLFDIAEIHASTYSRIKRLTDLLIGIVLVPLVVLLVPVVWTANLVWSPGPLLFKQSRIGKGGKEFTILKFRSMSPNSTPGGRGAWTSNNDGRITRVGAFLRRSHVDELPQVFNIIRGDLALVGPRPEQPHYVEQLTQKIPFYSTRHLVRPGLTGWAQVNFPYGSTDADAYQKLQYDLFYLRQQSLLLDLRIMGRTMQRVLAMSGR